MVGKLLFFILSFPYHPHSSIVENHSYVELNKYDNGYSEERYHFILDKVINIYRPIFEDRNGTFDIMRDWTDGAVNMWAWRWGDEYWLEVPGGMARYYLINEEAFLLSVCHEIGHLLGGSPGNEPISYEGQSDYFASLKCIKRVLPEISPETDLMISNKVKKLCQELNHLSESVCQRALEGALSLTSYYAELEKSSFPKIETPSTEKANQVLTVHPPAQCRLDTFVAGLSCNSDIEVPLSFSDPIQGTCETKDVGGRPRCWYP